MICFDNLTFSLLTAIVFLEFAIVTMIQPAHLRMICGTDQILKLDKPIIEI